jgi:hypothetical protein
LLSIKYYIPSRKLCMAALFCFTAVCSMAQTDSLQSGKYRKWAIYGGVGPSYFFNNLVALKNNVNSFQYAASVRIMWEPENSVLSLGFETGYYRLYTVHVTQPSEAHVSNSSVPLFLVLSMKFSTKFYANWSMGQSITFNQVSAVGYDNDHNATTISLADFSATVGYRFVQKKRISYAAELKGFYSSSYANGTLALLFIVGYRL